MYIYVHIYIHHDYRRIKSHHVRMVELTYTRWEKIKPFSLKKKKGKKGLAGGSEQF